MGELPWSTGTWTKLPAIVEESAGSMTICPLPGTDFWRPSVNEPAHEDGHALLAPLHDGAVMQVLISRFDFAAEFDQAGLYCWSPTQWAKAGVDVIGREPALMSVVTSPWSDSALTHHARASHYVVRASLRSGLLALRVGVVERGGAQITWVTQRMVAWTHADVLCGPYACAPDGLVQPRVTFGNWSMLEPDDLIDPIGPE